MQHFLILIHFLPSYITNISSEGKSSLTFISNFQNEE